MQFVLVTFVCGGGEVPYRVPLDSAGLELSAPQALLDMLRERHLHALRVEPWDDRKPYVVELTPEQADGRACVRCGSSEGTMIPAGSAIGGGLVFAHDTCDRMAYVVEPLVRLSDLEGTGGA